MKHHPSRDEPVPRRPAAAPGAWWLGRDLRLDACRGIALWFIFLDHVPDNIGAWLTLRNYGFSDTTEVFMFVSGVTCAMAYGAALRRRGWPTVIARSLRRSWDIYAAFLLLVFACAVLVYAAGGGSLMDDASNTRVLFEQPGPTLLHAAVLQYRPVNSDVLPTFVLFHLSVAPLLWLLLRAPDATLAASVLLYVGTRQFDWYLDAWPRNQWYFNPFAWQVLFVFGAWWALGGGKRLRKLVHARAVLLAAVAYLAASLVVVLGWRIEALHDLVPAAVSAVIYPVDKSGLDPLRLAHFLALAVVAVRIVPPDWVGFGHHPDRVPRRGLSRLLHRGLVMPVMRGAIRCGENSLTIYCLGVLLTLAAQAVLLVLPNDLLLQVLLGGAGIAIMIATANLLTTIMRRNQMRPGLF